MKVLVVVDGHLFRTSNGTVRSAGIYNYDFFARYLSAFEEVRVAIRIKDVDDGEEYPNICSGPGIEFFPIEEFRGPKELLRKFRKVKKNALQSFEGCDCAIFRIPSTVGYLFLNKFKKKGKPYALEVVIDPWDFAAPGNFNSIFRTLIRIKWTLDLKNACKRADGVSYVTKESLQQRYPSAKKLGKKEKDYFEGYYSSVNLPKWYFDTTKRYADIHSPIRIAHVTNNIGNYVKGHKELIEAVSRLKREGVSAEVFFVGEGTLIAKFIELSQKLGVMDEVHFLGKMSLPNEVRELLKSCDLFVFPSHAEGLPRVVIEAMAVGLPVVSTNINGIPELIDKEYLVPVGEVCGIVRKIKEITSNKEIYEKVSKDNFIKAHEYEEEVLRERREQFYYSLRNIVNAEEKRE